MARRLPVVWLTLAGLVALRLVTLPAVWEHHRLARGARQPDGIVLTVNDHRFLVPYAYFVSPAHARRGVFARPWFAGRYPDLTPLPAGTASRPLPANVIRWSLSPENLDPQPVRIQAGIDSGDYRLDPAAPWPEQGLVAFEGGPSRDGDDDDDEERYLLVRESRPFGLVFCRDREFCTLHATYEDGITLQIRFARAYLPDLPALAERAIGLADGFTAAADGDDRPAAHAVWPPPAGSRVNPTAGDRR